MGTSGFGETRVRLRAAVSTRMDWGRGTGEVQGAEGGNTREVRMKKDVVAAAAAVAVAVVETSRGGARNGQEEREKGRESARERGRGF